MVADEGELHDCSLAKNAVAFFKISRSMRSRLPFSSAGAARSPDGKFDVGGLRPGEISTGGGARRRLATQSRRIERGSTPRSWWPPGAAEYPCSRTSRDRGLELSIERLYLSHEPLPPWLTLLPKPFGAAHDSWGRSDRRPDHVCGSSVAPSHAPGPLGDMPIDHHEPDRFAPLDCSSAPHPAS